MMARTRRPVSGPHFTRSKICNVCCGAAPDIPGTFRGLDRSFLLVF
ncbi:hypothetical protein BVI2075_160050 [Burkholderia vietnamiensis]|nr:hypothetical protein BVI2075_160050 [Burkholderia vietnamiensis]